MTNHSSFVQCFEDEHFYKVDNICYMNKALFKLCLCYPEKGLFWIRIFSHFPVTVKFSVKSNFCDIFISEEMSVKMTESHEGCLLVCHNVWVTLAYPRENKNRLEKHNKLQGSSNSAWTYA